MVRMEEIKNKEQSDYGEQKMPKDVNFIIAQSEFSKQMREVLFEFQANLNENIAQLAAAFIQKTNIPPEQCKIVVEHDINGIISYHAERKDEPDCKYIADNLYKLLLILMPKCAELPCFDNQKREINSACDKIPKYRVVDQHFAYDDFRYYCEEHAKNHSFKYEILPYYDDLMKVIAEYKEINNG